MGYGRHLLFPFGGLGLGLLGLVALAVMAFAFWQLFRKAGFIGALGLLMLVPGVNLIAMLFLALVDWPVLRELRERRAADGVETGPDHPAWYGHRRLNYVAAPYATAPVTTPPVAEAERADERVTEPIPPADSAE
jgi:hypothetical protein